MRTLLTICFVFSALALVGCKQESAPIKSTESEPEAAPVHTTQAGQAASSLNTPSTGRKGALPANHPHIPQNTGAATAAPDMAKAEALTGKVASKLDAGKYVYLELEQGEGKKVWAAVLTAEVAVGDTVKVVNAALMRNFHSKTHDRIFEEVWFGVLGGNQGGAKAAGTPPGHPPVADKAATAADGAATGVAGKVVQKLDAGQYVYVELEQADSKKVWAAVTMTEVAIGDELKVVNAALMRNFHSKAHNRDFAEVWFGTLDTGKAAAAAPKTPEPAGGAPSPATAIEPSTAANAKTVAAIFAESQALSGQKVTVRGTVVKFNGGILGKNWVHLQDGTGSADQKTNDILITTDEGASKGEVVTFEGLVALDQDFGSGYKFGVMIEKGTRTKAE